MIATKAKEPHKAKAEAPLQKSQRQPASPQVQVVNPLWQLMAMGAQAKLAVSAPDDPHEREADRIAQKVMRMPERLSASDRLSFSSLPASTAQRKCATCGKEEEQLSCKEGGKVMRMPEGLSAYDKLSFSSLPVSVAQPKCPACGKEEEQLSRKEDGSAGDAAATVPPIVHEALSGPGQPLDSATREFFEPRFGHDLSHVRVHAGSRAADGARAVRARAYTMGRDIVFGSGEYAPGAIEGKRLLAHELTHVLQQGSRPLNTGDAGRPVERATDPITSGRDTPAIATTGKPAIWRDPLPPVPAEDKYPGETKLQERLNDIDDRLALKTKEYVDAYTKQDVAIRELITLKKEVAQIRRERFVVETIQWNALHDLIDKAKVDEYLGLAGFGTMTEEMTLVLLHKMLLVNPSGLDLTEYLLLNQPELFPDYVIGLYKSAVADLEDRAGQHKKNFDKLVAVIAAAPIEDLVNAFVYMLRHEQALAELADRINFNVFLDSERPVLLERTQSDSTSFAIDQIKVRVNDSASKVHPKEVEEGLGFLYPSLEAYYFYNLYSSLASQMELFRIAVEATYERLNIASDPDVSAELQRDYSSGIRFSAGAGYVDFHTNVASAKGGYPLAHKAMEKRLDKWVAGLSDLQKIWEGFGIYDLAGDILTNFKALFTLKALASLVVFFGIILAIQLVPFGNIIADIILWGMFGLSFIKVAFIFGRYFSVSAGATTFMQLYLSTIELQEGGAALVEFGSQLVMFGLGKAIGKFIKARGRRFKSAEDLKNDPIIKELPPEQRAEFEKLLAENKNYSKWKEKLSPDTKRLFEKNPELEKIYAEMDPVARDLLTLCNSPCIPEAATAQQGARIRALIDKLGIKEGTETFQYLREHLHHPKNRTNLEPAIQELEGIGTKAELQAKIETIIKESAQAKGLDVTRRPDGLWEVNINGTKVTEHSLQVHKTAPGTKSFFQSHHGIQGAWGRARIKGYKHGDAPTILLRDSNMGTPHQIVNSLQEGRAGGVAKSTYSAERGWLRSDMKAAGVDSVTADALLARSDAFYGEYYNQMKSNTPAAELESIFGDWSP